MYCIYNYYRDIYDAQEKLLRLVRVSILCFWQAHDSKVLPFQKISSLQVRGVIPAEALNEV